MKYNVGDKTMYLPYTFASVKQPGIPDSNLDEEFQAKAKIYDTAGNIRTLPTQNFGLIIQLVRYPFRCS